MNENFEAKPSLIWRMAKIFASPYYYLNKNASDDHTALVFKSILALEFFVGSIIIIKTVLFTRHIAERYKLHAIAS